MTKKINHTKTISPTSQMKKNSNLLNHVFCFATLIVLTLTGCNSLDRHEDIPDRSYTIDIDHYAMQNFFESTGDSFSLALDIRSPFTPNVVRDLDNGFWSLDESSNRAAGKLIVNIDGIPYSGGGQYTRDITIFVTPWDMQKIEGFGYFNYPIQVRQRGADGTLYLTAEELKAYDVMSSTGWKGGFNQHYILGTVKSISDVKPYDGIYSQAIGGYYDFPLSRGAVDQTKPLDLEARNMVVTVDGVDVSLLVAWYKAYNLVSKMNVKAGDKVEINIPVKGIIAGIDEDFLVGPLAVIKMN